MGATKYGNAGAVAIATPGLLSVSERETLLGCEERIRKGLAVFVDVGAALMTIREQRLYRSTHGTFDEYCAQKWGMTGRRANQIVASTKVVELISGTTVPKITDAPPLSERAARELSPLLGDPTELQATYQEAAAAAGGTPTAAQVREVVDRRNPKHCLAGLAEPGGDHAHRCALFTDAGPHSGRHVCAVDGCGREWGDEDDVDEDLDEPAGPAPTDPVDPDEPAATLQVWMAAVRRGTEYHELKSKTTTVCGRSTRTGLTTELLAARLAGGIQCRRTCFGHVPGDAEAEARADGPWPAVPAPVSRCARCGVTGPAQEMFESAIPGEDGPRCVDGDACRARRVEGLAAVAPQIVRRVDAPVPPVDLDATELDGVRVQVSAGDLVAVTLTDARRSIAAAWSAAEDLDEPVQVALQLSDGALAELIDMLLAAQLCRRERGRSAS